MGTIEKQPVVFIGPTMEKEKAVTLLDADYRPPAQRWDILEACQLGAETIILIDSVFWMDYAPSPKEIATVLARGVKVIGASSMGAIRAVELRKLGMQGIGLIYQYYASGRVENDDEVAVVYSPDTFNVINYPLINLRFTLNFLVGSNKIDINSATNVLEEQKKVFFPDRNYHRLKESCEELFGSKKGSDIFMLIKTNWIDAKEMDAETTLRYVANLIK